MKKFARCLRKSREGEACACVKMGAEEGGEILFLLLPIISLEQTLLLPSREIFISDKKEQGALGRVVAKNYYFQ